MSTQLPAHLLALFNSNPELAAVGENIKSNAHATIRYNGSKWKLKSASGEEFPISTPHLDVVIVDVNPHKSHVVYEKGYDPKEEALPPVWSSDDGTPVPAEHEGKVVTDYRRIAVLIADNLEGGIYELRLSPGSITNADKYISALRNHNTPVSAVVTRLTFDPGFDYPKVVFAPTAYLDENQEKQYRMAFLQATAGFIAQVAQAAAGTA